MNPPAHTPSTPHGRRLPRWIKAIALILILVGIGFRSTNLDLKPFWGDEVYSITRVSGYQRQTIRKQLDQQRLTVADLEKYRDPQSGQNWLETMRALSTRPEHTPLYFIILRIWSEIFGHSTAALRSLSVLFSVLSLGVFYLLGRSLFPTDSATGDAAGWGAMTLSAISPVLLRYAQETRSYSLWVIGLGLSTWALLRAWRSPSRRNWVIYALSLILAFHSHLLTLFAIIAHGVALTVHGLLNRWQQTPLRGWILTTLGSGIVMGPWLALVVFKQSEVQTRTGWLNNSRPLEQLMRAWAKGFSKTWVDLPMGRLVRNWSEGLGKNGLEIPIRPMVVWWLIALVCMVGVAIATVYLWRHSQRSSIITILSLTLVPTLIILAMDFLLGGKRSIVNRYFIATYVGLLALSGSALGSALAGRVGQRRLSVKTLGLWSSTVLLVLLSVFSMGQIHQAPLWGKRGSYVPNFASALAQRPNAVLVSDRSIAQFLALAYTLPPDQELIWVRTHTLKKEDRPPLPIEDDETIILFSPSEALEEAVKTQRQQPLSESIVDDRDSRFNLKLISPSKP
ncbi:MAG: glycosyltransferase family 39 protein [Cyanobacteria bacterium P01_H01_bin.130]